MLLLCARWVGKCSRAKGAEPASEAYCCISWLSQGNRILYRIWQIYQKPVDELVDLLGLDIPPVPEVSLAGITAESVLLYWKPLGNQSASLKHAIQVNGIKGKLVTKLLR